MRNRLFLWIILAAGAVNAGAIKPAKQADIAAIEAQLALAKGIDKEIAAAEKKQDEAGATVKANDSTRDELQRAVDRAKAKQLAALTKAIHMTILAWDIAPENHHGTSVMRKTDGRKIVWQPHAGEAFDRMMQNANGALRPAAKPTEDYAGVSFTDGVTFIPQSTFERGVGYLASTLLHERRHFDQYTSESKRGMSRAEREQEAWQAEADNVSLFFDPKKDKIMIDNIKTKLGKYKDIVKSEKTLIGRIIRVIPFAEEPDMAEAMIHTNEELADISVLVATARSQAAISRSDREKRDENARAAAQEASNREDDARLRDAFITLAQQSCANPGSVTRADLDVLPRPHQKYFYFLDPTRQTIPEGLGDCWLAYKYMAEGGTDPEEVRRKSTPLRASDYPAAVAAQPSIPAATATPPSPFSEVFPQLRDFAINACREPERVAMGLILTQPYDFSYAAYDINLAKEYAATMKGCPRDLFNRLIEMFRAGDWRRADRQWLRDTVAAYSQAPDVSPVYAPPSGGGRGTKCEDYGNINCPR